MAGPESLSSPTSYLGFPLRISSDGARQADRLLHIKENIVQALLTASGERVFLSEYGVGVPRLLFAPMEDALWARVEQRLTADVGDILRGEADPSSIRVTARPDAADEAILRITITYRLAALRLDDRVDLAISGAGLLTAETAQREAT